MLPRAPNSLSITQPIIQYSPHPTAHLLPEQLRHVALHGRRVAAAERPRAAVHAPPVARAAVVLVAWSIQRTDDNK